MGDYMCNQLLMNLVFRHEIKTVTNPSEWLICKCRRINNVPYLGQPFFNVKIMNDFRQRGWRYTEREREKFWQNGFFSLSQFFVIFFIELQQNLNRRFIFLIFLFIRIFIYHSFALPDYGFLDYIFIDIQLFRS